jgi:hypothetical protein
LAATLPEFVGVFRTKFPHESFDFPFSFISNKFQAQKYPSTTHIRLQTEAVAQIAQDPKQISHNSPLIRLLKHKLVTNFHRMASTIRSLTKHSSYWLLLMITRAAGERDDRLWMYIY